MSQKRTLGILLAVAVLMPLTVQSQTLAECAALTGNDAGDGLKAVKCVAAMAAQFEEFQSNTLPKDAIVLSTTRCESFGWEKLDGSLGRTVIGAGAAGTVEPADKYVYDEDGRNGGHKLRPYLGKPYKALDAGGLETVTLTKAQMPKHGHRISTDGHRGKNIHDGLVGGSGDKGILREFEVLPIIPGVWDPTVLPNVLEKTGDGNSHNNIPPYIALYFCKKN